MPIKRGYASEEPLQRKYVAQHSSNPPHCSVLLIVTGDVGGLQ